LNDLIKKAVFVLCVLSCALWQPACSPRQEEAQAPGKKPVAVTVLIAEAGDLPIIVESVGRLNPVREATLAPEISGIFTECPARLGDRVEKGAVLIRIDPADHRLALNEARAGLQAARARLETAEKTHARLEKLLPRKVISQDAFEKSEAEYKTALAAFSQAGALVDIRRRHLEKTVIRAPFSGFVASRHVEIGMTAAPGQPAITVADIRSMLLLVHFSEADYVRLDKTDPVSVSAPAFPGKAFTGAIHRMGIQADPATHTFPVEILVQNPGLTLKAGMSAVAVVTADVISDAVMIPQNAALYRESRLEVFVADPDQRALARVVELGRSRNGWVHVSRGLAPGDRVIVSGGQYLEPGDPIKIVEAP
jgi:RND family efflux transporter MFP subunit